VSLGPLGLLLGLLLVLLVPILLLVVVRLLLPLLRRYCRCYCCASQVGLAQRRRVDDRRLGRSGAQRQPHAVQPHGARLYHGVPRGACSPLEKRHRFCCHFLINKR
jgi:hypothetical protein